MHQIQFQLGSCFAKRGRKENNQNGDERNGGKEGESEGKERRGRDVTVKRRESRPTQNDVGLGLCLCPHVTPRKLFTGHQMNQYCRRYVIACARNLTEYTQTVSS